MKVSKKLILYAAVAAMVILHQDVWFWDTRRLVFGVLPFELAYHAVYTILVAVLMWLLARHAWPAELDREDPGAGEPSGKR